MAFLAISMGLLSDRASTNKRRWNYKIEKQDAKDEFARLGHRALIIHSRLIVVEQGAIHGGTAQSGPKIEF